MGTKHTDEEITYALGQAGSKTAAAKMLGVDLRNFTRRLDRMAARDKGFTGNVFPVVPAGHKLKGVSSLQKVHDPETGETVMQWVKTAEDAENSASILRTALDALKSEIPRAFPSFDRGKIGNERLASLYVLTDYHLGMYSWPEETGEAWDIKIAEDLLVNWFRLAIESGPNSHTGILAQLGDFLHYDTLEAVTPTAKNQLDADSRAQLMIRVALRVLRRVIDMLLVKHDKVIVLMAEGNHDIISSVWLREAFKIFYENEPRVTVDIRPDPYYAVQWGKTALFFHHGHMKKPEMVDKVFASKFREIFGSSEHCYGHMGHMHHLKAIESALMDIEQHPTMTASDAFASRHGYLSKRRASVITYDKEFGEVSRQGFSPKMVQASTSEFNS